MIACGDSRVTISGSPLTIRIEAKDGRLVQRLRVDAQTGSLTFDLGDGPVLGLGEGGPQFDRRGSVDRMRSGQGGYRLRTHGGRVPIPWLIGTAGWAMFVHQPYGSFDLTGGKGRFVPARLAVRAAAGRLHRDGPRARSGHGRIREADGPPGDAAALVARLPAVAPDPGQPRRDALRGPDLPREEAPLRHADLSRHRFLPVGLEHRTRVVHLQPRRVPRPQGDDRRAHGAPFPRRAARRHPGEVVRAGRSATRSTRPNVDESSAASYWNAHRKVSNLGVDGWWPDEGDPLDVASRLARIRMYYEGQQLDRPDARPYALHRNGYAGMQRYAAFLWSGDVYSTWETLKTHVPIAINTSLTGIPLLGHRHRRVRPHQGIDRRALRPLVPVRCVLPVVPLARADLEAPPPLGLEHRRTGAERDPDLRRRRQPRPRRAAQRGRRADLPQVPGTPLSSDALPLQRRPRGACDGAADHAVALAP